MKTEYTIKTVCPYLLRIEANGPSVQPSHVTVRELLLQNQHSEFAINSGYAHQRISRICLDIWSPGAFEKPISALTGYRFQNATAGIEQALDDIHPLLRYSSQAWFEHLLLATPGRDLLACLTQFLRTKALFWIETAGILRQLRWLNLAAAQLEQLNIRYHHIKHSDRELISGWAVDLVRIVPAFGQKIVGYPSSVHELMPPFCPKHTCIGGQAGDERGITVVGTAAKTWEDCLSRILVHPHSNVQS